MADFKPACSTIKHNYQHLMGMVEYSKKHNDPPMILLQYQVQKLRTANEIIQHAIAYAPSADESRPGKPVTGIAVRIDFGNAVKVKLFQVPTQYLKNWNALIWFQKNHAHQDVGYALRYYLSDYIDGEWILYEVPTAQKSLDGIEADLKYSTLGDESQYK